MLSTSNYAVYIYIYVYIYLLYMLDIGTNLMWTFAAIALLFLPMVRLFRFVGNCVIVTTTINPIN